MNREKWIYKKENIEFEMDNTAMGIKQFGIIYSLIENGYLTKDRILIIDEPEVHLHPKWQIEYAKILVELAKNGIKILLTSHSPFFIEAIENLYPANFYLAKDGFIKKCNPNDIYELLSESIDILEDLQMESREW
jgi:predicted ATPase